VVPPARTVAAKPTRRNNRGIYYKPSLPPSCVHRTGRGMISMGAVTYTTDIDLLLTETEAATLLNISTRTLQAWRIRTCGPAYIRAGRAIRYRKRDLLAWMEANTVRRGESLADRRP